MERVDDDMELLQELATLFLEDIDATLGEIAEAFKNDDLEALHRYTHALKGSVANFAADAVFNAAKQADDLARNEIREGLPAALEQLREQIQRFRTELEEIVKSA